MTRSATSTALAESFVNALFVYVLSLYLLTGAVKGQTLEESVAQLQKEWFVASFSLSGFWQPVGFLNFRFVPAYFQTFTFGLANVFNKVWRSWLTNRERAQQRPETVARLGDHTERVGLLEVPAAA